MVMASVALLALPALAQSEETDRSGFYQSEEGQTLTADLTKLADQRYMAKLSTTIEMTDKMPGCGGSIEGEVEIQGDAGVFVIPNEGFIATEAESVQNKKICTINIQFSDEFTMKIEEASGCSYYHGASCSFDGTLLHEASGI